MTLLDEQHKHLADIATRTPALYLCLKCGVWRTIPLEEHVILTRNHALLPCLGCYATMVIVVGTTRLQIKEV